MDEKWIDSIKDKMADYEIDPPAYLFETVEAKVRSKRMRKRVILGAIAASIALIVGVSVALIPDMHQVTPGPSVSNKTQGKKGSVIKEEHINQIVETVANSVPVSIRKKTNPKPKRGLGVANTISLDPENNMLTDSDDNHDESEVYEEQIQSKTETQTPTVDSDYERYSEYLSAVEPIDMRLNTQTPILVGVSTSANGLCGIFGDGGMASPSLLASASVPGTRMGGGMLGSSNAVDSPAPTFIEIFDHKLPVRASVDFSWPLGYNLSIGAGLTYSYLRSDIRYGYSDSPLFKATQSLHFLGIPVNVRFTPWSFKKLDIYASAGVMAEKCITGEIKTENPLDPGYGYVGCEERPFQFSVNAAAGLQYSLAGSCAVFIEPGIGIYLKNGSCLRTIYSERSLSFTVNVGLRFGHRGLSR